jgi:hypothetical protein
MLVGGGQAEHCVIAEQEQFIPETETHHPLARVMGLGFGWTAQHHGSAWVMGMDVACGSVEDE